MRGFTRKRGKTWTALWDQYDPATGRRQQKSKGGFRTQKEAQQHLATVITRVAEGTYVEPSKQPLARFLQDEWLPSIKNTVRPLTSARYRHVVEKHVATRDIGSVPLRALSGAHLTALYVELEEAGLSVASRRAAHTALSRALSDAVRWGKLPRNPAKAADPPSLASTRVQSWTARELRVFMASVQDDRLYALWRLAATTGMRRGELLGLTWRSLDIGTARLRVEQQLIPTASGRGTFGPPKSRRSERTIALDTETVETLRRHRKTQQLERDLAGAAYVDHDLVFCDELGEPIIPMRLTLRFAKYRKAAGISTGTLHILRHTSATLALTANPPVPLHVVAGRLGDDPKTVLGTYAHLLPNSDAQAAETVASVLADTPLTDRGAGEPRLAF
jgi:integrase